jgi:hypothetical protein
MLIRFRPRSRDQTWSGSRELSADQSAARYDLKLLVDGLQRLALVEPSAVRVVGEIVAGLLDEVDHQIDQA